MNDYSAKLIYRYDLPWPNYNTKVLKVEGFEEHTGDCDENILSAIKMKNEDIIKFVLSRIKFEGALLVDKHVQTYFTGFA